MIKAKLPNTLTPKNGDPLIRLGRDGDGGYLVGARSVSEANCLISFGVSDDWSFEQDFQTHNNVPVTAYDGSVSKKLFKKRFLKSLKSPYKPQRIKGRYELLHSYTSFFEKNAQNRHITSFVGPKSEGEYVSFKSIAAALGASDLIFLKIDIEGWEYRILDELIKLSPRISGLAIEFHDVDLHMERICQFVRSFPLGVCHVHANNYSPITIDGTPFTIEMCFSRYSDTVVPENHRLPHELDMPNLPNKDEIELSFY